MYKRIKGKKFSRKTNQRKAFMRTLAANLILAERIRTTKPRARQTASLVERMITKAKAGDLASKKALAAFLPQAACRRLVETIAPRFADRSGGYTRVVNLGSRTKDGAAMAIVELLDRPTAAKTSKKKNKTKTAKKSKKETTEDKKEE
jgi:large subunit ribosomal protein L17